MENPILSLRAGDEVAIMPLGAISPAEVLEISKIVYVRSFTLLLANAKLFARCDGRGLVTNDYIVRATDEHRLAVASRQSATPSDGG